MEMFLHYGPKLRAISLEGNAGFVTEELSAPVSDAFGAEIEEKSIEKSAKGKGKEWNVVKGCLIFAHPSGRHGEDARSRGLRPGPQLLRGP